LRVQILRKKEKEKKKEGNKAEDGVGEVKQAFM
jgi:hypothetical protein